MTERSEWLPHLQLNLTTKGKAKSFGGRDSNKNSLTSTNLRNRQAHGSKIKNLVLSIITDWQNTYKKREEEDKPKLPDILPFILEIDPETFDLDDLRTSNIEIISELEGGYIIGASADADLTELQRKIELFFQSQKGGGIVAKVLDIRQRIQGLEFILSPYLLENWDQIRDERVYVVDVGISCLGSKSKLSNYPKQEDYSSAERYRDAINRWIEKRDLTYGEWDELASERQHELIKFVAGYKGEFLSSFIEGKTPKFAQLPDSFSCRIQISGKGLRDLVFNFPFIFEVTEKDNVTHLGQFHDVKESSELFFKLEAPEVDNPKVCVIDSGIQEQHPLLEKSIDAANSKSWVPLDTHITADLVSNGGHGTRVAGAILYPRSIPRSGKQRAVCWIQNARVLDHNCRLSDKLYPPELLENIVENYYKQTKTRIFNHSITADVPCRTRYMSAWAAAIDKLTWEKDILFIVAAGNIYPDSHSNSKRLSIRAHLNAGRLYPEYLLENSCRVANPAQSFQALTVGSVTLDSYNDGFWSSVGEKDQPSAFSCSGLGIWETIKPEVVEYGGDLVKDGGTPPNITCRSGIGSELVRSTLGSGSTSLFSSDAFGTSFAAPKVTHIAARLAAEFPDQDCLLYRALIVQSARWPQWAMAKTDEEKQNVIRQIGYGIPNLERALNNAPNRSTLMTRGENKIRAKEAHIYQVKLPDSLISPGEEFELLVEITLSYKAQPRRTRRNRRKYLSTWLDWECSKQGEDPEHFKKRILEGYDTSDEADEGGDIFTWTLGKHKHHKTLKNVSRSVGTLQKDWAFVKSHNLRESFCIAVVGHEGWNNDPYAEVPYSLVVSFEAVGVNIPIYTALAEAQVETEVEQQIEF